MEISHEGHKVIRKVKARNAIVFLQNYQLCWDMKVLRILRVEVQRKPANAPLRTVETGSVSG